MASGACNGGTVIFGNLHCQVHQNIASGDIDSYTSWTTYLPPLIGGGFGLLALFVLLFFVCWCYRTASIGRGLRALLPAESNNDDRSIPPIQVV
uniref:FAST n=1 Tax=Avian orthoreovirus TaxID=38170 RepID=A0A385JBE1_9REOV|nr:FAST [Avian orthoreovirus]